MKSTENVLNLWVSFDANSVIIARFLYQVKTWCCLVPSRAAGAEWVRVKCGAGRETLCPVATPPLPRRQLPVVTSPPCRWAAWTLVTVTRAPGVWDIPKCRRCWWPHLHGAAECVQRAEGGVLHGGSLASGVGVLYLPCGAFPWAWIWREVEGERPQGWESCVQPALLSRLRLFWKRRPFVQGLGGWPRSPTCTVPASAWLLLRCSPRRCPRGSWDLPQSLVPSHGPAL